MTALVKDELSDPSTAFGFMLKLVNEIPYNSIVFGSTTNPNKSIFPRLEIEYMK